MIQKLADLELHDKTVFLRVDFNVPIDQGRSLNPIVSTAPCQRFG